MVLEETLFDYVLTKAWTPINENIILPIRIYHNKSKPIKFIFTTTFIPKKTTQIQHFLPFLKQKYGVVELQDKKDFTQWAGKMEFNNMLSQVYINFTPNYDLLLENEDVFEHQNLFKTQIQSVKISFEVYCPLGNLENLLTKVNSELDEFLSKMSLGNQFEFNQIIFETKKLIKKIKVKNLTKIETHLNGCRIEAKKKICYMHLDSWIVDSNTIKKLYKLLFLFGI